MTTTYANRRDEGDFHPCEIIEAISGDELLIRDMIADRDPDWKTVKIMDWCMNNDEQLPHMREPPVWSIVPDPDGILFTIKLNKSGVWKDAFGHRYELSDHPIKFHDFNRRGPGLDLG